MKKIKAFVWLLILILCSCQNKNYYKFSGGYKSITTSEIYALTYLDHLKKKGLPFNNGFIFISEEKRIALKNDMVGFSQLFLNDTSSDIFITHKLGLIEIYRYDEKEKRWIKMKGLITTQFEKDMFLEDDDGAYFFNGSEEKPFIIKAKTELENATDVSFNELGKYRIKYTLFTSQNPIFLFKEVDVVNEIYLD